MKLIVGLGNPGKEYEKTRHNVGFLLIDYIYIKHLSNVKTSSKLKALILETTIGSEKVIFVKPLTYMNLSGEAVRAVIDWYKIDLADVVIAYDDLDLPLGKIRWREKGSAGGHNGIKSIIQHLGTDQFQRVKIGIDRSKTLSVVDYVLQNFPKEDWPVLEETLKRATEGLFQWIAGTDFKKVMSLYN